MEFPRTAYLDRLITRKWNGLVKTITGSRRVGKSYILNELFPRHLASEGVPRDHVIKIAFDSDDDLDMLDEFSQGEETRIPGRRGGYRVNSKVFRRFIRSVTNEEEPFYLLLDEVQLLDNFAGTLNSYLRHRNFDVYASGSNSKFLSSDIATEFRGRSTEIRVFPLTFAEYTDGLGLGPIEGWKEYIVTGGIPLVALMTDEEEKVRYLENLCRETYLKDIINRNGIRKREELSDTFNMLASMIGTPLNPAKLANTFQSKRHKSITDDTIRSFINYFEDAFLIERARQYDVRGRRYIDTPFKVYFGDVGIRNARLNFRQVEETHIMENVLYNELRARGFSVDVGRIRTSENTGRKDANGHDIYAPKNLEVDFVASLGQQKYYIQSALAMPDAEKREQESRPLYHIEDSFKKIIVTKNGLKPSVDERGVVTVDLFDFLLNKEGIPSLG